MIINMGKVAMNKRFIYDEKTSNLFSPDGVFLKKVFCPKAMNWNQLIAEDGENRWRECSQCKEKVINLDVVDSQFVLNKLSPDFSRMCIYATSNSDNVIFLKDPDQIPKASLTKNTDDLLPIYTARNFEDIERSVNLGYWPDVRMMKYDMDEIRQKISVGQHKETGHIDESGDYRFAFTGWNPFAGIGSFDSTEEYKWNEVIPFTYYYPDYQSSPIAAYLIPNGTPNGTKVIVIDPIEDMVGSKWNQGSNWRASNVPGYIKDKKVILEPEKIEVLDLMG
jgi:hypothetical protein